MQLNKKNAQNIIQTTPRKWLIYILAIAFATCTILIVTAPKTLYPGDPVAIRLSAEELVRNGRIDVPAEIAARFGERGQYFYENPLTGLWYPKYGITNILLYAIPLSLERLTTERLPSELKLTRSDFDIRLWWLNLLNIVMSSALAIYLFMLGSRESSRYALVIIYVLSLMFSTFMWNYLRAHTVEIFQVLMFTAAWYHAVSAKKMASLNGPWFTCHCVCAMLAIGWLVLGKLVYSPLLVIISGDIAIKLCNNTTPNRPTRLLILAILEIAIASLVLFTNWFRFGSPWSTGYDQWVVEREFLHGDIWRALVGYLVDKRMSVFIYFPPLVMGIIGLFTSSYERRYEWLVAWTSFGILLVINASFINWRGEWCYGPRYLLFALPVLSLPGINVLHRVMLFQRVVARRILCIITAIVVIYSLQLQIRVNMLDFLMPARVAGFFKSYEDDVLVSYFWNQPYWTINTHLLCFAIGRGTFPPLEHVRGRIAPHEYALLHSEVQRSVSINLIWMDGTKHLE